MYRTVEVVAADGIKRRVLSGVVRIESDGVSITLGSRNKFAENVSVD